MPDPVAHWSFEQNSYNGTSGEVLDTAGANPGTAVGGATTADTDPAYAATAGGLPSSGRYLLLDGSDDHVSVLFRPPQTPKHSL